MRGLLSLAVALTVAAVAWAEVQIPPGYEVVNITGDPEDDRFPRMNNCGEVVFRKILPDGLLGVFLYDNGKTTQVSTDGDDSSLPDVNDDGTIVWTRHPDGFGGGEVVRLRDGVLTVLGEGSSPRINNLGHVVWARWYGDGCWYARTDIMFYDGVTIEQLTDDPYNKQHLSINDHDQVVWKWVDFCVGPTESEIILWVDGETAQLTTDQIEPGSPSINNRGHVVWSNHEGIDLWEDGVTTALTGWGRGPMIDNRGEIVFHHWDDDLQLTLLWWYRDGVFYRITDGPFSANGRGMNDDGETVWHTGPSGDREVWMLRRVRNADTDLDSDVDHADSSGLPECMTGPVDTDRLCACRFYDLDHDRDVDLRDFGNLQNLFTGEN